MVDMAHRVNALHLSNTMYQLCKLVPDMNYVEVKDTLHWLKESYKGKFNGSQKRLYGALMRREEELMGIPNRLGKPGRVRVYNMYDSKDGWNGKVN